MADVSRHLSRPDPQRGPTERGQLILITALSLAILFVALALILNTAIYTENLATRSGDIGGATDAVRYHDAAASGIGGIVGYVNVHNNTSYDTLQSNLSAGVDAFRNQSARQFAYGDRAVETSINETTEGTRIAQTDPERNVSNVSGSANWTVVEDINNTRAFSINVTSIGSLEAFGDARPFQVVVNDSENTWRMNVTEGPSGDLVVGITNSDGDEFTCSAGSEPVVIDVTAGTVGGERCDGLEFADGLVSYDITFENADNIQATFSMVVDSETLADQVESDNNDHLVAAGDGNPFAAHAVFAVTVDVVYETPRLKYEATVLVAPEDGDG